MNFLEKGYLDLDVLAETIPPVSPGIHGTHNSLVFKDPILHEQTGPLLKKLIMPSLLRLQMSIPVDPSEIDQGPVQLDSPLDICFSLMMR